MSEIDLEFTREVGYEVHRATKKFPNQEESVNLWGWLSILVEEVGEVARELNEVLNAFERGEERPNAGKKLREELVQVAAMAERMAAAVEVQKEEL